MSEPLTISAEREAYYRRVLAETKCSKIVTEGWAELDATRNELEIVTRDRDSWKSQSQTHNIDLIAERAAHKGTQEAMARVEAEYVADIVSERAIHKEFVLTSATKLSEIGEQLRHSREVWTELLQECRDKRAWLKFKLETAICHVPGEYKMGQRVSDGWCAVRLPDWDVKQKIESLDVAIALAEKFEKENLNERTPNPTPN